MGNATTFTDLDLARQINDLLNGAIFIYPGTPANPGVGVNGDPTTGLFSSGSGIVGVSLSGGEIFRFEDGVFEFTSDNAAATSPPGKARFRYNNTTVRWESSVNGGAWTPFGAGAVVTFSAAAGENLLTGDILYISGDNQVMKADNTNTAKIRAVGVADTDTLSGNTVDVMENCGHTVRMVGGLTLSAGDKVYLTTTGRGTNVVPVAPDEIVEIGKVIDSTVYVPAAPNPIATVFVDVREPMEL